MSLKQLVRKVITGPLFAPVRSFYTGCATVLMYHSLTEEHYPGAQWGDQDHFLPHLGLFVHVDRFREQMRFLRDSYHPLGLPELSAGLSKGKLPKGAVCVTFDDGWADNLHLALPILEEFSIPATIFITTGFIDRSALPWWLELEALIKMNDTLTVVREGKEHTLSLTDPQSKNTLFQEFDHRLRSLPFAEQFSLLNEVRSLAPHKPDPQNELALSLQELQQLAAHPLITIGAHTLHHPVLSCETEPVVRSELSDSRRWLSETLNQSVDFFAYPIGDVHSAGAREVQIAEREEFELAFTTRPGHVFYQHSEHRSAIPRINIDYFDDHRSFHEKLEGFFSLRHHPKNPFVTV